MINKDLLNLPGADVRRSIIIGILQAVGALAEIMMLPLAIFGLGHLFGLGGPAWLTPFLADPLATMIWLLALAAVKCLCIMIANQSALKLGDSMGAALSADLYLSLFDPTRPPAQDGAGDKPVPNQSMAMLSTEGVKSVCTYFTSFLPTLVQSTLMIVVAALVLLPLNWAAGLIVIIGMAVLPFAANTTRSKEIATQVNHLKKYDSVGVRFEEALRGLPTLKIFGADLRQAEQLNEESEGFRKATMDLLGGQLRSLIGADGIIYIAAILASLAATAMGRGSSTGLMTAVVIAATSIRLFSPERQLVYLTHAGTVAIKHGKAILKARAARTAGQGTPVAQTTNTAVDKETFPVQDGTAARNQQAEARLADGIHIQSLTFAYPDDFQALDSISFDLPTHGHFGLVGASGSGKSTLAGLLTGRLTGYQGSITIDGQELSSLPADRLVGLETIISGNDHLFSGSIRSNLDPAGVGYSDEQLTHALVQADLNDLLSARGGLDAQVEQAGANLSGGQRQRLCIARGLLRDTPIYIFDEATSAVDRDHDRALATLMDELGRDHLVITITHRLAGVRQADRILVLEHGTLAQSGSFDLLSVGDGPFAQQWREQDRLENLTSEGGGTDLPPSADSVATDTAEPPTDHTDGTNATNDKTASALPTMKRMATLMFPLKSVEFKAIACGTMGHLCSIWAVMCGAAAICGYFMRSMNLDPYWKPLAITAVVMGLLRGFFAYGEQYFNHQMAFSTLRDIRGTVFDTMRKLAPAKLHERGRGDLVAVVTNDIELLEIFYAHTLSPIAIATLTAVINAIVLACISPRIGLAAILCYLVIAVLVPLLSAKTTFRSAMAERNAQGRLHSLLLETLDGRRELLDLGAATHTRTRLAEATDDMLQARSDTDFNTGWNDIFTQTATLIAFSGMAALIWILALTGHVGFVAAMIAFIGFISSFAPLVSVARLGSGLQPTLAAARRVFALMDEEPAVRESEDGKQVDGFTGIAASGLSFTYAPSTQSVLDGINLSVEPGTIIGIQGSNGAGKSTLIDLLLHFRERTDGQLTISGQPIEQVRTSSLRGVETLVSQETFIFSQSLADNISIARPEASREEVEAAARQACLDDVINQLPQGLDQVLNHNGAGLSEGQKQRISVARAFLSQAPFIAMDEPTSNMDALLEGRIIDALLSNRNGKTYLIVSHRPAVLAHAQHLLTLHAGKLTQER
ncbi:ABC transporter ATP-binding protein/permease [Bifidobacterium xylocopae]|uniref:ABC transporter ATP-binding protein n=1 Tax=Bifidobacterium xylocopae TaxID=2493119 RepID=A0A366KEU8_9BIFI|nr:ATP-binding cassette domain-containing protein [Bifidobacterium xylocopae]RBP99643.1 ABC transporter ATP-binding protein [Bifidobacterium xylocopae]